MALNHRADELGLMTEWGVPISVCWPLPEWDTYVANPGHGSRLVPTSDEGTSRRQAVLSRPPGELKQ